jgi:hypothetical protein
MTNASGRTYNQPHVSAQLHAGEPPVQRLLGLELSVGGEPGHYRTGQPVFHYDGSPACWMAEVRVRPLAPTFSKRLGPELCGSRGAPRPDDPEVVDFHLGSVANCLTGVT